MNEGYIQNLRYKLQKRVRRLNSIEFEMFHVSLKQFWGFLNNYEVIGGIIEDLCRRYPQLEEEAEKLINQQGAQVFENELENAAFSYFVIKKCVESADQDVVIHCSFAYKRDFDGSIETFRSLFLEPFYEYIDEQLDDQKAILALLRRYKHKCEWFQRDRLYKLWKYDTQRGEKHLALDLYEYLHDQGLDFTIEPWSISGKADLVSAQKGEEPLIADAKIFNPESSKGKDYISKGFNQLYQYTLDYNETFGYLIIFKTCDNDIKFALTNQEQSTPFIIHNNKTIFLITIDIFPHQEPASKRGVLKPLEISENDLIQIDKQENLGNY